MNIEPDTFLESRARRLSFAVQLLDEYTKSTPMGGAEVFLKGGERAVKSAGSQYYKFIDLPEGEYRILVRSANYFDEISEPINTENYNNKNPIPIWLVPRPSYPFPPGETLVRGRLIGGDGEPIVGGRLSVRAANEVFSSRTTETGEFVIYFGDLSEEDVTEEEGRYFVRGDTDTRITIIAEGESGKLELDKVEVGETRSINFFVR